MTKTSGASSTSPRYGLTEGLSSKIMRASRPSPLPSLMLLHQKTSPDRTGTLELHGRLEELLVFEIPQHGDAIYKRFNVRTLHKYVMKAIRSESKANDTATSKSPEEESPLGRGIENMTPTFVRGSTPPTHEKPERNSYSVPHAEVDAFPKGATGNKRLGGFLHPRDMRKLITPFSASNEPELLVRRHAMLLNFDPLRAIILRDRAMVLVPSGADSLLVQLENRIRGKDTNPLSNVSNYQSMTHDSSLSTSDHQATYESAKDEHIMDNQAEDDAWKLSWIDMEWADIDAKGWMDLPFELQCVDAILSLVTSTMAEDVLDLQLGANSIILELVTDTPDDGDLSEETLRTIKNTVREMMSRVQGFNRALNTVLEDNTDLAMMNLSRLLTHPERFVQPVPPMVLEEESDDPELLLEAHVQQGYTLINALVLVKAQITSTEDYANRKSDAIRNQLLYVNTVISILTLSVGVGSVVGSFFGMNVPHPYSKSPNAFVIIVFATIAAMVLICAIPLIILLKPRLLRGGFVGQVIRMVSN